MGKTREDSITEVHQKLSAVGGNAFYPAAEEAPAAEETEPSLAVTDETPDESWTKTKIAEYLEEAGVEVPSGATKAELLELVE